MAETIIEQILIQRKNDIAQKGFSFGIKIPAKRNRPINPFMQTKGAILEVKRASPSKGDICPNLDAARTALEYRKNGAHAISCLTEEKFFKGNLNDLISVCNAVPDVAVLRKDFLLDEEEIELSYRCGADAVLLIAGILSEEKLFSMTEKCKELGIKALVEVRTEEDAEKVIAVKKHFEDVIVCGVNSRNLKDFSIDLLVPAMLKEKLGGKVIFESGITTPETAAKIGTMGFTGILLGEFAARNPEKACSFVNSFMQANENLYGKKLISLATKIHQSKKPLVKICGLTQKNDVLLADELGADFVGFVFASEFARNVFGQRFDSILPYLKNVKAQKVAVITNPNSPEAIYASNLVKDGILDFIQLHGILPKDTPEFLKKLPHFYAITEKTNSPDFNPDSLFKLGEARFFQDLKNHQYIQNKNTKLWLAGGVTKENVESLIDQFSPELIDISSGAETNEIGIKDKEIMTSLLGIIKNNNK